MKIKRLAILSAVAVMLAATSCKPTEAGYKAAYEAAQAKRAAEQDDAALYGGMFMEGAPHWRRVGTDSVLYMQQPLAPLDGDSAAVADVNVAIASYKMNTNAKAHAERLKNAGLNARVLRNNKNSFLVIAAQYDSIPPAVSFIDDYIKSHPDDMYAGLPGRPIVTSPSGRKIR